MPIYEYECKSCQHQFDLIQKISDPPIKQCPQCFEETAVRLISAAGFQLKGSGWYVTDFKEKTKKDSKKEEIKNTKADASTDATKTSETKKANETVSVPKKSEGK